MPRMMKLIAASVALLLVCALASAETKREGVGTISVRLQGFQNESGVAVCALFQKDGWRQAGKGRPRKVSIREHRATCEFAKMPYGAYAVAAFHDEDGDGEFDKRLGVPVEGHCFSNRATPKRLRPPSFDAAKFEHNRARTGQLCELR